MSLYEDERLNYVRLSCMLEKVRAMLILLFRQCYSTKNGKEWSESFGTTFHNQDKFSDRYFPDQRKCIKSGQVEDWDISLLCDILLNSSYFFLVDPPLLLEVQCEYGGCNSRTKYCKNNQHGSSTLKFKFKSPADSAKLSAGSATLLRVESKRLHKLTFDHALDMGIVVKEKLRPNEYTIYPCSKKWVAVDQLRAIRNDFSHMTTYKISEKVLMDKAEKVRDAYKAFEEETSEIDAIMSECVLDHKKWQTEWEKCTQLKAKSEAVGTGVYYIKFDDIKQGLISEIKEDTGRQLASMKEGLISEIKEDTGRQLASIKADLISEFKLYEPDHISRDVGKVPRPLAPSAPPPPKQELIVHVGTGHQPLQQPNPQMNIFPPLPTTPKLSSKKLELLRRHSLSERDLVIKCGDHGDDLFRELSIKAVHTPHTLAITLGLERVDIEQIERDYKSDYKRQVTQIFWKWRERNGKDATFLLLIDAFIEEENIEAAEIVLDFFKNHCQTLSLKDEENLEAAEHVMDYYKKNESAHQPILKSHSQTKSQSEKGCTLGSYSSAVLSQVSSSRKHSSQESQRNTSHKSSYQREASPKITHPRGRLQHNNACAKAFDFYFDDLVAHIFRDESLLLRFIDLITTNYLRHPIETRKASNPCMIIVCKTLVNDVWTFLDRARNPERALAKLLSILDEIVDLKDIITAIKSKALEFKANLPEVMVVTRKKHKKDYEQANSLMSIQDVQMTELMDNSTPSKSDDPIIKYARKLKSCYQQLPTDKWSPAKAKVSKFIDVVLENKSMDENASLSLDELFNLPCRSWVLLEGISGIGKSTLAYEMCKRWANGTALQEYSLVILLSLREDDVQHMWSPDKLEDLLIGTYLNKQSWKLQVVQDITDNDGEGLLIILEGFDELPEEKQLKLDILKRMKRDYSEATVMITTRSSSAQLLSKPIQFVKHFEIHGFNVHNQNRYIEIFLKDKALIESFKKYIDRYPVISRCLRIPLNLAIVLEIFCRPISTSHSQLPETMTELYESLIKMVIYREKESQAPAGTQIQLSNLKKLPEGTQEAFNNLCALAYEGIILNRQQQVFYKPEKFETLGLMRRDSKVLDGGDTFAYSFLHITIQEFLAAYHIVHQFPLREVQSHFDKYNNVYKLFVTMRFLTGLTKLQDGRLSITIPDEKISSMSIFHQLMETKNDALVSQILNKQAGTITVKRVSSFLTEQDFYILGKCIGLSSCTWKLGFTLRALTDKHMDMLVAGFKAAKRPKEKDAPRLEHVVFSLNEIGSRGIISFTNLPPFILKTISELYLRATSIDKGCLQHCIPKFDHFIKLETFLFHDNDFKEGEQQPIINALSKLKYLKKVSFSNLSSSECVGILANIREIELYDLSQSSIEAVFTTLSQCRKLECVEIYQSQITKEIAEKALTQSHPFPIQSLRLINCAINSDTACVIVDAVTCSPTLQTLDLSDNIIDDMGGCYIADRIGFITSESLPLSKIFLHHNSFSEAAIYCLIDQLVLCPSDMSIYLSLQWELVIKKYAQQHSQDGALKHFKFERPNSYT